MTSLEKHDKEIQNTLVRINKCIQNNSWNLVYDLNKYLTRLLKERKEYVRLKKGVKPK